MLEFMSKWEPVWLFIILFAEFCINLRNWQVLEKEFLYDKEFNEQYIIPKKKFKQKKKELHAVIPPTVVETH